MADEVATEAPPRLPARRIALGLTAAVVVGAVVILSIGRLAGFAELTDALEGARWHWLFACVIGQVIVFAGYAGVFRHAVAFEGGPRVARRVSFQVIFASFGLTQLVAAGGAAGLAITYWALRQIGLARRDALVRLIGLNTAVYFVFAVLAWSAAALALLAGSAPLGMTVPWLVAIPLLVGAARWFTQPGRIDAWTNTTDGVFRSALATGVASAWWVRRALSARAGRPVFGAALWYWIGDLVSLWAALRAFGATPGLAGFALAYATGYLAQAVPIPLIATGGVDAATTFALTAVGVPVELALLGVVAHRVFAFWLPIVPGLLSAVSLTRAANSPPAAEH